MLSWAGLRGAVPIWLATLPVIAGIDGSDELFNIVFFVVVSSTLIQGFTFEPLAERLGLTTNEPALPQPLRRDRDDPGARRRRPRLSGSSRDDAAVGRMIKELGLPRRSAGQPDRPRRRGAAAARLDGDRGRRRAPPARPARDAERDRAPDRDLARGSDRGAADAADRRPRLAADLLRPPDPAERRRHRHPAERRRRRGRACRCEPAATSRPPSSSSSTAASPSPAPT